MVIKLTEFDLDTSKTPLSNCNVHFMEREIVY
jgi:hypothetical protein